MSLSVEPEVTEAAHQAETGTLSDMATVKAVEEAPKKQRGRPKKPEEERSKRKQISVYVEPEIYESLKDISYFTKIDIAHLVESAIIKLIESNKSQLQNVQNLKKEIESIRFDT